MMGWNVLAHVYYAWILFSRVLGVMFAIASVGISMAILAWAGRSGKAQHRIWAWLYALANILAIVYYIHAIGQILFPAVSPLATRIAWTTVFDISDLIELIAVAALVVRLGRDPRYLAPSMAEDQPATHG